MIRTLPKERDMDLLIFFLIRDLKDESTKYACPLALYKNEIDMKDGKESDMRGG